MQAGRITGILNGPDRFAQAPVAAELGRRRQHVGMLVIVAAVNPATHAEENVIHFEVVLQMFGHLTGLFKGPVDHGIDFFIAGLVHLAVQEAPEFEIGCAPETLAETVFLDLRGPGDVGSLFEGDLGLVSIGDFIVIPLAAGIEGEAARVLLLGDGGAELLPAIGVNLAFEPHGCIFVIPGQKSGGMIFGEPPELEMATLVDAVAKLTLKGLTRISGNKHPRPCRHQYSGLHIGGSHGEGPLHQLDRDDLELARRVNREGDLGLIAGEHRQNREIHIGNLLNRTKGQMKPAPLDGRFATGQLDRVEAVIDLVRNLAKTLFAGAPDFAPAAVAELLLNFPLAGLRLHLEVQVEGFNAVAPCPIYFFHNRFHCRPPRQWLPPSGKGGFRHHPSI